MKKKEDILTLIKSLSKSEKRYFKLFVGKNIIRESSHYIKLFDLIDKAGSAEKQVIEKLYQDEDFMESQFRVYKYLLYKQILKSLSSYHSERSIDDIIMELIRHAKILLDKTMYVDAAKMLEKAKSMAYKYEKHAQLVEIISWQKKIQTSDMVYEISKEEDYIRLYQEEQEVVSKILNASEYWKFRSLMFISFQRNGLTRTQEDVDMYNSILNAPFLNNEKNILSYHAEKDFYSLHLFYSFAVNKLQDAYEYAKKIVVLMEKHPLQIEDNPTSYISALHNLLYGNYSLKKHNDFFNLVSILKSTLRKYQPVLNENVIYRASFRYRMIELAAYVDIGQFKKATQLLSEIEGMSDDRKNTDFLELTWNLNIALLHFANQDYHKALMILNTTLNNEKNIFGMDKYSFLKIFQLIVHFEKGSTDLLPYLIKSVYRYLLRRKKLYKMENAFIKFIETKLSKIRSKKDQIEAFKELRENLVRICDDPQEARFLEVFDIISWLESKIRKRPFEEILREKSGYVLKE